jgi:L-ascorbate metabolism protein UlaG (beta-lactamase superfamily)
MNRRSFGRIVSAAAALTLGGVGYSAAARSRNRYYDGPASDHFDGVTFYVPGRNDERGLLDMLRWQSAGGRTAWPDSYPSPFQDTPPERVAGLRVVMVGHASLLIQVAGQNILVDPVWSPRASPFQFAGPKRANPPGIAFDALPAIDTVLITHNHYDHLDGETLDRLWARFRPRIVAPLGNDAIIRSYDGEILVESLDWGQSLGLGGGIAAHLEPALHWSARGVNDRRMALWGAYVLTTPAGTLYLAGDTGYGEGATFRAVRARFGAPRLAVLPIGAYAPRWFMSAQHMDPAEAVKAFADLGAEQALGIHWGTFRLSNEGVDEPARELAAALDAASIAPERFLAMRPGQVWERAASGTALVPPAQHAEAGPVSREPESGPA